MVEDLIQALIRSQFEPEDPDSYFSSRPIYNEQHVEYKRIPTLEPHTYRAISPMLKSRFDYLLSWRNGSNGDWLSIEEMEQLWEPKPDDTRMRAIKDALESLYNRRPDEAPQLFRADRLSLFATEDGRENVYLLWLEGRDEPEVWHYTYEVACFKNLTDFLQASLSDDRTAYDNPGTIDWYDYRGEYPCENDTSYARLPA